MLCTFVEFHELVLRTHVVIAMKHSTNVYRSVRHRYYGLHSNKICFQIISSFLVKFDGIKLLFLFFCTGSTQFPQISYSGFLAT